MPRALRGRQNMTIQQMTKTDLYNSLGMDEYFYGDSFELNISAQDTTTTIQIFELLDKICLAENRTPIHESWRELHYDECSNLLKHAFHYDLAYENSERMLNEEATAYQAELMGRMNKTDSRFFTNWDNNPWNGKSSSGWSSITENTYDMAIILMDEEKLIFTYFISED